MAKGVTKIYTPEQFTSGALFISQLRKRAKRDNAPAAEIFEIFLPNHGVVELTCEEPSQISIRPKAKTAIRLIDPFFTVRNRVTGAEGNKRARVNYVLNAKGFEVIEGAK